MIHIYFLLLTFLFAWPAFAVTSCPSGMVLTKTSASPILDCICFGGQRPRMNISSTGNPTALFGSCPDSQTFYPAPTLAAGVPAIRTGTLQTFIVPQTGIYTIEAWGAQGGQSGSTGLGGKGAYTRGEFSLTIGNSLTLLVGQQGENDPFTTSAGGGGATSVLQSTTLLMTAGGGGGGGSTNGQNGSDATSPGSPVANFISSAAGSYYSSTPSSSIVSLGVGLSSGYLSANSGRGGARDTCTTGGGEGGFGSAGGGTCNKNLAGAGGGYRGGSSTTSPAPGGTSYIISTALNTSSTAGIQIGGGKVVISW